MGKAAARLVWSTTVLVLAVCGLLARPAVADAAAIAGVVPADRMTDWTAVGCPEPLPRPALVVNVLDHGAKADTCSQMF